VSLIGERRQLFRPIRGLDVDETPRKIAFCDHTIRSNKPMVIEDAMLDDRFADNPMVTGAPGIRSYAGAPLTTPDGYNLGALCAIDRKPRSFPEGGVELLSRFAHLIVEQLELRTRAHRDFLTGTLTRRAFSDDATNVLGQLAREPRPGALLVLDIDHFKLVNDSYGHPTGDRVLKAVAQACEAQLQPGDLFGRLGGEEFAILLNGPSAQNPIQFAERLRRVIEDLAVADCTPVTASFGLVGARASASLEVLLAEADAALYTAKQSGRNRCVVSAAQVSIAA
jgi:diguanylate cyclase (GGDEF)-like protein